MYIALLNFPEDKQEVFNQLSINYKDIIIYYDTLDDFFDDYFNNSKTYMAIFLNDVTATEEIITELRIHVRATIYLAVYSYDTPELEVDNYLYIPDARPNEFELLLRGSKKINELLDNGIAIDDDYYHFEFFKKIIHIEIKRAKRYGIDLSLLYLTLDNIEELRANTIEDTIFPQVIKMTTSSIRDIDLPINIGEEAILILMPHTNKVGATVVAERIYGKLSVKKELKFSISIVTTSKEYHNFSTMMTQLHEGIDDSRKSEGNRITIR